MKFNAGEAIQINEGIDIYDTVRNAGVQFGGSSDNACQLAVAARGVGIIQNLSQNWVGEWYSVKWQNNQKVWGYYAPLLEQNFHVIPGVWNDPVPFF